MSNATTETRKSVAQLKELVFSCGMTKDQVREYGDLRKRETWEDAYCRCAEFLALAADADAADAAAIDPEYLAELSAMPDAELYAAVDAAIAAESELPAVDSDPNWYGMPIKTGNTAQGASNLGFTFSYDEVLHPVKVHAYEGQVVYEDCDTHTICHLQLACSIEDDKPAPTRTPDEEEFYAEIHTAR